MRLWMAAMMIGAVALPLAACDRQAPEEEDAGPSAPAVVETPTRKAGLWKQTMSIEGLNMIQTVNLCLDAASEKKVSWWAQQGARGGCDKNDVQRNPDGSWSFSSVCHLEGGMKTTTTGQAVGDFQRAYQVKAESTTEGSPIPAMNRTNTVTIDATWLGECPAGMVAGDMDLPSGQRMNVLQMAAQPPAKQP
jgi:hypothetical protein